jgi:peptide/nickel transport system permease protein
MSALNRTGVVLLAITAAAALGAPRLAPHAVDQRFAGLLNAPPTRLHVRDAGGRWRPPFIYAWRRVSQLEQQYEVDRTAVVPVRWFADGHVVSSSDDQRAPLLLCGADSYGRDVFARLVHGARVSLGLALASAIGAVLIGLTVGGAAGYLGGTADESLMRASEFILVLPAMYVALALRSVMPLVLSGGAVFALLTAIFAIVGAPFIARGVRAIVRSERSRDYAVAARSLGASHSRLILRHLLPAARGFVVVQLTMLIPAFIVAEATLSYVGLGFPESIASWGTMLQDASTLRAFADFPWLLAPALAMFLVVLGLNLLLQNRPRAHRLTRPL